MQLPLQHGRRSRASWRRARLGLLVGASLVVVGCGFAWLTYPPDLPPRRTDIVPREGGPQAEVEVLVDERGVPHIYGQSEADVAYALGFLHARDRLFQILVLRHVAQGRLTELFGDELIGTDLTFRLLTYRLDDQVAALDERDRTLLTAYLDGLNKGAGHAGRSAEMRVLGVDWEPFTLRDVLSVVRLQSWGLSMNLEEELARSRVLARLPDADPRRAELLAPVPSGGVPVFLPGAALEGEGEGGGGRDDPQDQRTDGGVPVEVLPLPRETGDGGTDLPLEDIPLPAPGEGAAVPAPSSWVPPRTEREALVAWARELAALFGPSATGASNSWVVHGSHTASGNAILCNDPHLRHLAPSVMYLVHLETPDLQVVGATLPGIPAVVIGHTRHLAWGLTTSFADTQDLVEIAEAPGDETRYLMDGQARSFGRWNHRFSADDEVLLAQTWRTTVFGPVLPEAFEHKAEPGSTYALQWTGFDPEVNARNFSGFWDLYRARTPPEARAALELIGSPSQNVTLAFTDGSIAYHLMGAIPRRRSKAPIDRPRDGRSSDAGWAGFLAPVEKPALDNPPLGYIVTANQRVVDATGPGASSVGASGASPHRALRIHERLRALLAAGTPVTADDLLAIQQDAVSAEAQRLQPLFAARCPETLEGYDAAVLKAFCAELQGFDGEYSTLSRGALPFTWLLEELQGEILATHLGTDVALQLKDDPATLMAIERAIVDDAAGREPALLDDLRTPEREGLVGFLERAIALTLDRLGDDVGTEPEAWRWGRHHILQPQGSLATAPVVGGSFRLPWRAQSGHGKAPRAEAGLPIRSGAVLRLVVELSDPPQARSTIDLGQSGHFGHEHMADQRTDWDLGRPRAIPTAKADITLESHLRFLPAPGAPAPAGTPAAPGSATTTSP